MYPLAIIVFLAVLCALAGLAWLTDCWRRSVEQGEGTITDKYALLPPEYPVLPYLPDSAGSSDSHHRLLLHTRLENRNRDGG